jgi:hypothetical protein
VFNGGRIKETHLAPQRAWVSPGTIVAWSATILVYNANVTKRRKRKPVS